MKLEFNTEDAQVEVGEQAVYDQDAQEIGYVDVTVENHLVTVEGEAPMLVGWLLGEGHSIEEATGLVYAQALKDRVAKTPIVEMTEATAGPVRVYFDALIDGVWTRDYHLFATAAEAVVLYAEKLTQGRRPSHTG